MSFGAYESYRDSGLAWLGDIPSHWRIERLKRLCDVRPSNVDKKIYEDEEPVRLCNYTDVYYHERLTPALELMEATATFDQIERFGLLAGDVIITKDSETSDDIAISAYVPETMPGVVCGYHLALLRPRSGIDGRYLKRFFDSAYAKGCVAVRANGLTRVGLGQYALENLLVPTPPEREQSAIAAFLDRETSKIDTLVEEQRRLIELLKEKRQAAISHAVSRGCNPSAPMKDSGVEWLGQVPAHWQIRSIASCSSKITNGYVGPTRDILLDDGIRYLQSLHIKRGQIVFDPPYFVGREWSEVHAKSVLQFGDVLIVQTGSVGQTAVVTSEFVGCNCHALIIVTPVADVLDGEWFELLLRSDFGQQCLASVQTGALHPHLNCGNVKLLRIPVPPIAEQRSILEGVQATLGPLNELIEVADAAIPILIERRGALISAAVTGKIDVRERATAAAELEPA